MTSAPMTRVGHSACLVWTMGEAAGGSKIQCAHCAVTKCAAGKFSYLIAPWPWISDSQPKVNTTLQPPPRYTAEQFCYANNGTLVQSQEQAAISSCCLSSSAFNMHPKNLCMLSYLDYMSSILSQWHYFKPWLPKLTTALFNQKPRLTNCWKRMFFSISQVL